MQGDDLVSDLAGAILDGEDVDWASADSSAGPSERPLLEPLRLLATIAHVHRQPPDPQQWGPLRVLDRIGRGAFGQVYRAWDTRLDREVALKLLPADRANDARGSTLVHEGRLLARVRHPNVVTIYGAERIEDRIGLWMEFIRGRTLEQMLQENGPFSAAVAVEVGIELCRAVTAVHAAGLLHRDIKAQNVMLTDERRVVLMDFGTGREREGSMADGVAGTPLYLAPEVVGRKDASVQSDIYGVGVLLYHLLTGSYPVQARSLSELHAAHERRERQDIRRLRPDLPPRLCRIIDRAIAPDPDQRYETADRLGAVLSALASRRRVGVMWTLAALLAAAAVAAPLYVDRGSARRIATPSADRAPSIAVLPFRSLGATPVEEPLQLGMADAVIARLSGVKTLAVRPTAPVTSAPDTARDPVALGRQLHADHVLDGTIQRAGNRVRVTTQLVDVATGRTEWADTFDESFTDLFALQDAMSMRVAGRLVSALTADERRAIEHHSTGSLQAYELYVRGKFFWEKRTEAGIRSAIGYYQQALRHDDRFALAYAGLASCYVWLANMGAEPPQSMLPALRAAASKAVELDDHLAETHTAMSLFQSLDWNWPAQEASYRRAIELNPNYPNAYLWYGLWLDSLGRQPESLAMRQRAHELDPLNLEMNAAYADSLFKTGHEDEALKQIARTLELDPDFWDAHHELGLFHLARGRFGDAVTEFEKSGQLGSLGHAYARAGDRDRALGVLRRLEAESTRRYVTPLDFAAIYAGLGDADHAFEWLEQAFRERTTYVRRLDVDARYEPLRRDARYGELLKRIRAAYLR